MLEPPLDDLFFSPRLPQTLLSRERGRLQCGPRLGGLGPRAPLLAVLVLDSGRLPDGVYRALEPPGALPVVLSQSHCVPLLDEEGGPCGRDEVLGPDPADVAVGLPLGHPQVHAHLRVLDDPGLLQPLLEVLQVDLPIGRPWDDPDRRGGEASPQVRPEPR